MWIPSTEIASIYFVCPSIQRKLCCDNYFFILINMNVGEVKYYKSNVFRICIYLNRGVLKVVWVIHDMGGRIWFVTQILAFF